MLPEEHSTAPVTTPPRMHALSLRTRIYTSPNSKTFCEKYQSQETERESHTLSQNKRTEVDLATECCVVLDLVLDSGGKKKRKKIAGAIKELNEDHG